MRSDLGQDLFRWLAMVFFLLVPSIVITLTGGLAVILIWRRWPAVEGFAKKAWPKPAVAFCRAFLATAGVFSKETIAGTPQGEVDWWWIGTLCAVISGWLLWEVADWWSAEKLKSSKATDDEAHRVAIQDLEQAHQVAIQSLEQNLREAGDRAQRWELASLFRARLLAALRRLLNTKNQRILQELKTATAKAAIHRVREALDPEQHRGLVLEQMAYFLHQQLPHTEGSTNQNFRVCLYANASAALRPVDGFDFNARKHHPFSSFEKHSAHFRLDNTTDPAHAVRCIQQRRLLIVPDCATNPDFKFLSDEQRAYLKSLVAYPIMEYKLTPQGEAPAAVVIDTDLPGHFREEDREAIEYLMREFAAHLILEEAILKVVAL